MDQLPVELVALILKQLDIKDIKNCTLVSKKFNLIINFNIRVLNLAVCNRDDKYKHENFFYTNQSINSCFTIDPSNGNVFKTEFMRTILSKARRLYIDCKLVRRCVNFEIESILQHFEQIHQLQLDNYKNGMLSQLNLVYLRILSFENNHSSIIKINCPQLTAFKTKAPLHCYEFRYPEMIRNLNLNNFKNTVQQFINLEKLFINNGDSLNRNVFKCYSLQEVHCCEIGELTLVKLLNHKNVTRSNLKLTVYGIAAENDDDLIAFYSKDFSFPSINNSVDLRNEIILKNYLTPKICHNLPWFRDLHMHRLVPMFQTVPDDFLIRCPGIRRVIIGHCLKVDQHLLINFLKNCQSVRNLHIESMCPHQWFLDDLPKFCKYLTVFSYLNESEPLVDESFFVEMKYLDDVFVSQNLSIETISKALTNLKRLTNFHFIYDEMMFNYVHVGQEHMLKYRIDLDDEKKCYFFRKKDVVEFLRNFDSANDDLEMKVDSNDSEMSEYEIDSLASYSDAEKDA